MSLATKNVATVLVGIGLVLALSFAVATPAKADMLSDLQAQVQLLLAQISALSGGSTSTGSCFAFTRTHQMGDTGGEVMEIQKFLNSHGAQVSASGAGSPGNESNYYGAKTKAAVAKWQAANGVAPAAGYWGPLTRAKVATKCTGTTPTTPTTGGGVMIMAASQPANSLAPKSASRVPFTRFTLSNNTAASVSISGIVVKRTGLASNSAFSGVGLVDEQGIQMGVSKTLNSDDQATVGDTFTLNPGQSKTFTVVGNMASSLNSGEIASLSVIGVNTSGVVSGSLPITGAQHTLNNTLAIGTAGAVVSTFDPNSAQTKSIGDTNVKFAGVRVTANANEDVRLWSVRFNQAGSAGAGDLSNVMVYVDATAYPTTLSSDGKYYTATFSGGVKIEEGLSKEIYIQGDVVGSSVTGRTVRFDIYKNTDIYLTGETYGYGVTVTNPNGSTNTTSSDAGSEFVGPAATPGSPFFHGSLITVNPGSATSISRATSVGGQNIAANVPDQVLGGFTTDFRGEPVDVQQMVFFFNYGTALNDNGELLTNVKIVDSNGAVVAGSFDGEAVGGTGQSVTFTDTVTFPVGAKTYTIKGKVPSTVQNDQTIIASTTPSSNWTGVQGQTSGNSITLSNGLFSMSTMTVKGPSLVVGLSSTPASKSIVAGGTVHFADIQLDASQSGEDVRIAAAKLDVDSITGISTCQIWNGANALTTGSNVVSTPTAAGTTFTFDNSLTIPKGQIVTVSVKCNASSQASGSYTWSLTSDWTATTIAATGVSSGSTLSAAQYTINTGNAGTMTVGQSGTLAVTLDAGSPSYNIAANGSTGVTLSQFRVAATNEAINLTKLALQMSNAAATSSPSDLLSVTLWDGATQIGTATFTGTSRFATSSLTTALNVGEGQSKVITVKGNLATLNSSAGTGNNAKPGALIQIDADGTHGTGTQGSGVESGATINATVNGGSDTAVAGVRVFRTFPIITYAATGGALTNGTQQIASVTVNANSTGDVTLHKLTFNLATTTATLTSLTFTGPNGSVGSSTPVLNTAGSSFIVYFDSVSNTQDKTIGAGSSKVYNFSASVAGLTGSTAGVVSVGLESDDGFPSTLAGLMGNTTAVGAAHDIVWSPNSTSTPPAVAANNDWTSGYGLGGCFATSGLGQDCFAVTKAQ